MNKKQDGFGVIGIILLIVVIGVIGGAAYYVGNKSNKKTEPSVGQSKTEPEKDTQKETKPTTTFNDKNGLYSLEVPKDWVAENFNDSKLTLKPKELKAPGQENNWVVSVDIAELPHEGLGGSFKNIDEFKKMTLEQKVDNNPINETMIINDSPAWKFGQTIADHSPTGPPELSGGYQDLSYYFYGNKTKIIDVNIRVYQHASTNYTGTQITSSYDYTQYIDEFEAIAHSFKLN